jgi:hypothetical protein
MCTDFYRHLVAFGGVPALFFLDLWMGANFTERQYDDRLSPGRRALISHVTNSSLQTRGPYRGPATFHRERDRHRFRAATGAHSR